MSREVKLLFFLKKVYNIIMKFTSKIFLLSVIYVIINLVLVLCININFLFIFGIIYLIIICLVIKNFSKNVKKTVFRIEEMAAGGFLKQKNISKDEIGQFNSSLNELVSRVQTGIAQDVLKYKALAEAKTDFIAIASHQLRTPLSIIKWYVDFLASGDAGELNLEQIKYLKEVYDSNERLIELVNALLDVSRIDLGTFSIEPESIDILKKADEAIDKFSKEIKQKNIIIDKKYDEFPKINLDPRLTKIVFENIISNSVKYILKDGIIQIIIKKIDNDILIKISDNGCGIPKEQQPKVFSKLFRAENARNIEAAGTGLGLYIVKAIIEKSGGKIWFQSPSFELLLKKDIKNYSTQIDKKNKGTTFFITIPLKGMKKKVGTKKLTSIN